MVHALDAAEVQSKVATMQKLIVLVALAFALAIGSSMVSLMVDHTHMGPADRANVASVLR
jgi:hypothetical protein